MIRVMMIRQIYPNHPMFIDGNPPDEETCILRFLREARECGYPSSNEEWYPIIDSIMQKYYDSDVKEAQWWQTL